MIPLHSVYCKFGLCAVMHDKSKRHHVHSMVSLHLQEARRLAQESCQVAQGKPEWQQVFQHQVKLIDDQMVLTDRERQVVYFQAISKHCSQLPPGKLLVKPIKFEPLKLQHELG